MSMVLSIIGLVAIVAGVVLVSNTRHGCLDSGVYGAGMFLLIYGVLLLVMGCAAWVRCC